jgi:hypothetical protein
VSRPTVRITLLALLPIAIGCTQTTDRGATTAVFVEDFGDRSGRPELARSVTGALRDRVRAHDRLRLATTSAEAEVVLDGALESALVAPGGRAGASVVLNVTASARDVAADRWLVSPLKLTERQPGGLDPAIRRVTGRILILTLIALDEFE